jgi:hypothetical protein
MMFLALILIACGVLIAACALVVRRRRLSRLDMGGVSDRWLMSHRMEL